MSAQGVDMLDVVAEQLRAPLQKIQLLAQTGASADDVTSITATLIKLLDNLHLAHQIEREQLSFILEPVNIAELTDEAAHRVHGYAALHQVTLQSGPMKKEPVLAHRDVLLRAYENMLHSTIDFVKDKGAGSVMMRADSYGEETRFGVYADGVNFYAADLKRLRRLFGKTRRPIGNLTSNPAAQLYVADTLLGSMGARLRTSICDHRRGFATELSPSAQLSFLAV